LSDAAVFADIFNTYIYGGARIIQPEHLMERNATKIALPYGKDGKWQHKEGKTMILAAENAGFGR